MRSYTDEDVQQLVKEVHRLLEVAERDDLDMVRGNRVVEVRKALVPFRPDSEEEAVKYVVAAMPSSIAEGDAENIARFVVRGLKYLGWTKP